MEFEYVSINKNDYIKQLPEYKAAVELAGGRAQHSCCIDGERNLLLFILGVEYSQERPPGEYVLFCGGEFIKMAAYKTTKGVEGVGVVATYLVDELDYNQDVFPDQSLVLNLLQEALWAVERNSVIKPASVSIEFLE